MVTVQNLVNELFRLPPDKEVLVDTGYSDEGYIITKVSYDEEEDKVYIETE